MVRNAGDRNEPGALVWSERTDHRGHIRRLREWTRVVRFRACIPPFRQGHRELNLVRTYCATSSTPSRTVPGPFRT